MIYYNKKSKVVDIDDDVTEVAVEMMELLSAFGIKLWEAGYDPEPIFKKIHENAAEIIVHYQCKAFEETFTREEDAPILDNKEG